MLAVCRLEIVSFVGVKVKRIGLLKKKAHMRRKK
jgi:hypothetical protein